MFAFVIVLENTMAFHLVSGREEAGGRGGFWGGGGEVNEVTIAELKGGDMTTLTKECVE